MAVVLEWKDPPPKARTTSRWAEIAEALKAKPGEWALCAKYASRNAAYVAANIARQSFKTHDFQARGLEVYGKLLRDGETQETSGRAAAVGVTPDGKGPTPGVAAKPAGKKKAAKKAAKKAGKPKAKAATKAD